MGNFGSKREYTAAITPTTEAGTVNLTIHDTAGDKAAADEEVEPSFCKPNTVRIIILKISRLKYARQRMLTLLSPSKPAEKAVTAADEGVKAPDSTADESQRATLPPYALRIEGCRGGNRFLRGLYNLAGEVNGRPTWRKAWYGNGKDQHLSRAST